MLDTQTIGEGVSDRIAGQSRSTAQIALTIRAAQGVLASARAVREAADLSNTSAVDVMALARDLDDEARRIRSQVGEFFGTLDAA
ncbi:hypothetical protein AB4099_25055 [Bosea sp. 2KB_26]|uniref:hypothetical protein n=1 Tax=Bosea sp. 2KB_26 TaxID=3237475 RepID=UPI003F8F2F84